MFDRITFHSNPHYIPVDTRRKLNVHKTFRRRPGRLLNVLCTFNLHPVSTGMVIAPFIKNCDPFICRFVSMPM